MKKKITKIIRQYSELVSEGKPHLQYKILKKVYTRSSTDSRNRFIFEAKQFILKNKGTEKQKNISE